MTPIEQFLRFLVTVDVWTIVKLMVVFGVLLYVMFAVVVIRQVELMSRALNGTLDLPLKLVAWLHLGVAVVVLGMAIVVL